VRSLPPNPKRYYSGVADIVTGITTDGRRFARLEVQKASDDKTPTSTWIFATAVGRGQVRALDGLSFVMAKLFVQDPIYHQPSVTVEYDEEETDGATIWADDDDTKRDGVKG